MRNIQNLLQHYYDSLNTYWAFPPATAKCMKRFSAGKNCTMLQLKATIKLSATSPCLKMNTTAARKQSFPQPMHLQKNLNSSYANNKTATTSRHTCKKPRPFGRGFSTRIWSVDRITYY